MNLNNKVVIESWGSTRDDTGGSIAVLIAEWPMRADVKERSGSRSFNQSQEQWDYDYKITFRYEKTRPVASNDTIRYDGRRLAINSLSIKKEADRSYYECRCITKDLLTTDTSNADYQVNTLYYISAGNETVTTHTELIGKKIIGAFMDGENFIEITDADAVLVDKQIRFTSGTGSVEWSVNLEPRAQVTIQFGNV